MKTKLKNVFQFTDIFEEGTQTEETKINNELKIAHNIKTRHSQEQLIFEFIKNKTRTAVSHGKRLLRKTVKIIKLFTKTNKSVHIPDLSNDDHFVHH